MRTWNIIDNKGLQVIEEDGTIRFVGLDVRNKDYKEFLAWAAEQVPPVTIPEGWPTL